VIGGCALPPATSNPTPASVATGTPSPTRTPTQIATRTSTPTLTLTPMPTSTSTLTPTRTPTLLPPVEQLLARCPAAPEIAAINANLKLSFEYDPTAGKLVCTAAAGSADLTLLQRRIYQRLLVIQRLTFSKPLPWTDQPLYTWFVGVVNGIRFRRDIPQSYCCDPRGVINVIINDERLIYWNDQWADREIYWAGAINNIGTFVHEGRHADGERKHNCGSARDLRISDLGAWGAHYYYYVWLVEYSDPNYLPDPFYRQAALKEADKIRKENFCAEP